MKCGRKEVVVLSSILMCALVAGGFLLKVVLDSYVEGRDRAACILNIRNIQQTVRGEHGVRGMNVGDPLDPSKIHSSDGSTGRMTTPKCPSGGTYTYINRVPKPGELFCTCSHAETKGHVPEDYEGW